MKTFVEALLDSESGWKFDAETFQFFFQFGSANEYELCLEPLISQQYLLALYHHGVLVWPDKIPVRAGYTVPTGPGDEQEARRKAIRDYLEAVLAEIAQADEQATRKDV